MAIITFYIDDKDETQNAIKKEEILALGKAFKGTTTTFKVPESDVSGDKITSMKAIEKAILTAVLSTKGLSKDARVILKDKGQIDGKLTKGGEHDFYVTVRGVRLKGTLDLVMPVIKEVYVPKEGTDYVFANSKVKSNCDKNFLTKIHSIAIEGPSYRDHGKVPYLDGALHAHVTHTESLAWFWEGKKMRIVATGVKNPNNPNQAQPGKSKKLKTMSYDWTTK
jgi:hypothetical protein